MALARHQKPATAKAVSSVTHTREKSTHITVTPVTQQELQWCTAVPQASVFEWRPLINASRREVDLGRPHTYGTLFGLLASTGMRISEALSLRFQKASVPASVETRVEASAPEWSYRDE
jgi:hypothetical protein